MRVSAWDDDTLAGWLSQRLVSARHVRSAALLSEGTYGIERQCGRGREGAEVEDGDEEALAVSK